MSFAMIPQAYLFTIIQQIAILLLQATNGDREAAQVAAAATVAGYEPRNEIELHLIARIISFNLQAGEALAQASIPALPLPWVMRLRSGAVNLTREAQKAERALEKLRSAQAAPKVRAIVESPAIEPAIEIKPAQSEDTQPDVTAASMPQAGNREIVVVPGSRPSHPLPHQQDNGDPAERAARDAQRAAAIIAASLAATPSPMVR